MPDRDLQWYLLGLCGCCAPWGETDDVLRHHFRGSLGERELGYKTTELEAAMVLVPDLRNEDEKGSFWWSSLPPRAVPSGQPCDGFPFPTPSLSSTLNRPGLPDFMSTKVPAHLIKGRSSLYEKPSVYIVNSD